MKKLSLLTALLLSSSMVCAEWTAYSYNAEQKTYNSIPTSSCLEMICEHGCVEDSNTGNAYCCPTGTNPLNIGGEHPDYPLCKCPENQVWNGSACEIHSICSTGTVEYLNHQNTKACCDTTTHTLSVISGDTKACCPIDKPYWDEDSQSCLALCGPNTEFGIVLVIDRTGSMKENYTHYSETGEKEKDKRYDMVDKALSKLKVYPNAYSAVYENDKSPRSLDWGIHSKDQIKNAIFKYSFGDTGGTGFNEAFGKIEKLCRGDQKFVILWLTDGEITKTPKTLKKNLQNRKCDATLYMVSPKEKHKSDYDADKWVSFEDFSERTIEEFNEIVEEKKCYREGERNTPQTIGRPSCGYGQGYYKGKCNKCDVKYAESCDFHDLVCREDSCQKGNKCYLTPANAFCTNEDVKGGWICEANYYKNWDKKTCYACPTNSTSPAGSHEKKHCKCNANYYKKNNQCLSCPANSTSAVGSTESKHCKCNANYYKKDGVCIACPYGTRSPAGSTKKSQCK